MFRWKVSKGGKSIYSIPSKEEYTHSGSDTKGEPIYLDAKANQADRNTASLLKHVLVRIHDGKEFYFRSNDAGKENIYLDIEDKEKINVKDVLYMNKYVYFLFRHRTFKGMDEKPVSEEERALLSFFVQPPELYTSRSESGRQRGPLYITEEDLGYLQEREMSFHNIHQVPLVS